MMNCGGQPQDVLQMVANVASEPRLLSFTRLSTHVYVCTTTRYDNSEEVENFTEHVAQKIKWLSSLNDNLHSKDASIVLRDCDHQPWDLQFYEESKQPDGFYFPFQKSHLHWPVFQPWAGWNVWMGLIQPADLSFGVPVLEPGYAPPCMLKSAFECPIYRSNHGKTELYK